jgi:hypothetical protein
VPGRAAHPRQQCSQKTPDPTVLVYHGLPITPGPIGKDASPN